MRVGDETVFDLTGDRPGTTPEAVYAYISAATTILTRPITDPSEQKQYYIYARQFLPRAERLAPDLAAKLVEAMDNLSTSISQEITDESSLKSATYPFIPKPDDIEKIPDRGQRQIFYSLLLENALHKPDLAMAEKLIDKIENVEKRSNFRLIFEFEQADKSITLGKINDAEAIADRMPDCLLSAMLWLSIANAELNHNRQKAIEAVNNSLAIIDKLSQPTAVYLTLAAAGIQARTDPVAAESTFAQAIKRMNSERPENIINAEFFLKIAGESSQNQYPLRMQSCTFDLITPLLPLMKLNSEMTIQTLMGLENEMLLGRALGALSLTLIK